MKTTATTMTTLENKAVHNLLSKFSCLQHSDMHTLNRLLAVSKPPAAIALKRVRAAAAAQR